VAVVRLLHGRGAVREAAELRGEAWRRGEARWGQARRRVHHVRKTPVVAVHHGRADGSGKELWWKWLDGDLDVVLSCLGGEHALRLVAMPLALTVFLICVLHRYFLVHEILAVHVGYSFV
jgi:hypothetical protein